MIICNKVKAILQNTCNKVRAILTAEIMRQLYPGTNFFQPCKSLNEFCRLMIADVAGQLQSPAEIVA
ncbi:MAG: hypothetical protein WC611_10105, partial [Candidatus Neomarinimicrobiota bacterium]